MHLLKEWNIVCDAVGEGRQILLARKGGVLDADGLFVPAHAEFFLLPTLLHQEEQWRESIKPAEIARRGRMPAPANPDTLELSVFCRMTDALTVTDPRSLRALDDEHVWTPLFLEKRLDWGDEKKLTLLIVRAHRANEPLRVAMKPSYAGCKSWVETPEEVLPHLTPVLSNDVFEAKRAKIRDALGK